MLVGIPHGDGVNAFTIDVEGFVESNLESFPIPAGFQSRGERDDEIRENMSVVLDLLARTGTRATFFFLGRIAVDDPATVRAAADAGHEIACHGLEHRRIFNLRPAEFASQVAEARRRLEDVSGTPVLGFRAPDFSITAASLWALDVLKEAGFHYDSSIYPIGVHDVYGMRDASPDIHRLRNGLVEFPLATFQVPGRRFPFCGGGYFRLCPVDLTLALLRTANARGRPCMFYIHPYEIGPRIPRVPGLSPLRRFRHYYNTGGGAGRVERVLRAARFGPSIDVLRLNGLLGGT